MHLKNLWFGLIIFIAGMPLSAQENYKTSHPVGEFVNSAPHAVKVIDFSKVKFASKPKNIILLIGDGMGVTQLFAGYTVNGKVLNITTLPYTGFVVTNSADNYITDSAAGGTALACGHKTTNGSIGVDATGKPIQSILHIAEANGRSTGLVSTSAITHATPASFVAHVASRGSYEDIAADFLKTDIDVFIGGGRKHFEKRKDGTNLLTSLNTKGYEVYSSIDEAKNAKGQRVAVLTAEEHNPKYPERGEMLPESTEKAIELLSRNKNGFFLMVEGSQIDWGGHQNDVDYVVNEMLDFDRAVAKAIEFAVKDKNTLVIVTADHETGAMTLLRGDYENKSVKAAFASGDHTGVMVPVFAVGPGASAFTGMYENTSVFDKMLKLFGFNK
jgi:alkaline phosphatase